MGAAEKLKLVSVNDYLAGELTSPVKHEYLGGVAYAMSGASNNHNLIALNVATSLRTRLRGRRCRPYNSDTKIRVRLPAQVRFYYPDVSVVCLPNPPHESFQDAPVVLVEVLSKSTRRIDTGEKKDVYLTIPTLSGYLLVEQAVAAVTVFRRTNDGFVREVVAGLDAVVSLPEIEAVLPLREVYEDVEFAPESDADDAEGPTGSE